MYFHLQGLVHVVGMHPQNIKMLTGDKGKKINWKKMVAHKAWLELDDTFDPDIGYIVQIQRIEAVGEGTIKVQTGMIDHQVTYDALVLFPVQGEVIDAVIFKVSSSSIIFCVQGLVYGIVAYDQFPMEDDFEYEEIQEIEGKEVKEEKKKQKRMFVSKADVNKNLVVGVIIRLRIVKRAYGNSGFWLQGSMKNQFLGVHLKHFKPQTMNVALTTPAEIERYESFEVDLSTNGFDPKVFA